MPIGFINPWGSLISIPLFIVAAPMIRFGVIEETKESKKRLLRIVGSGAVAGALFGIIVIVCVVAR